MEPGAAAKDCGRHSFGEKRVFRFPRAGEAWRPPPGWAGQAPAPGQSPSQPQGALGSGELERSGFCPDWRARI